MIIQLGHKIAELEDMVDRQASEIAQLVKHLQRARPATAVTGKPRRICSAARKGADPKWKVGADAARVRAGRPIQADASVLWPGGAEQERTRVRSRGVERPEPAPRSRSNARRCFNPRTSDSRTGL